MIYNCHSHQAVNCIQQLQNSCLQHHLAINPSRQSDLSQIKQHGSTGEGHHQNLKILPHAAATMTNLPRVLLRAGYHEPTSTTPNSPPKRIILTPSCSFYSSSASCFPSSLHRITHVSLSLSLRMFPPPPKSLRCSTRFRGFPQFLDLVFI